MSQPKKGLLLIARDLGDAILARVLIERCLELGLEIRWDIWCRHRTRLFFENLESVDNIYCNEFPIGTRWNFGPVEAFRLCLRLPTLWLNRYDFSLDLFGDFREIALGFLTGSKGHMTPIWPKGHSLSQLIYESLRWLAREPLKVTSEMKNMYQINEAWARHLGQLFGYSAAFSKTVSITKGHRQVRHSSPIVGLHPFAAAPCKLWAAEGWRKLAQDLLHAGYLLRAYGAPVEREQLTQLFEGLIPASDLRTERMEVFLAELQDLDLLIGLDSFAVHAASLANVPTVVLNSAIDPQLWTPPGSEAINLDGGCPHHPCMNMPRCIGTDYEFACMAAITPKMVVSAAYRGLERSGYSHTANGWARQDN